MAPIIRHEIWIGSRMFTTVIPVLVINAPKRARDTRQADPIANPLPIAAVVFPAESKTSVLSLTYF